MNLSQKQNVCNAIQDFNTVENNFENIEIEIFDDQAEEKIKNIFGDKTAKVYII